MNFLIVLIPVCVFVLALFIENRCRERKRGRSDSHTQQTELLDRIDRYNGGVEK